MAVVLANRLDQSVGFYGVDGGEGDVLTVSTEYAASSVDKRFYVATRSMAVESIAGCVTTPGTDGGAVSAIIRKVASGTAVASGVALHSGTFNLKGGGNVNQPLVPSATAADLLLNAGDSLAVDFSGILTAAAGVIVVGMNPR